MNLFRRLQNAPFLNVTSRSTVSPSSSSTLHLSITARNNYGSLSIVRIDTEDQIDVDVLRLGDLTERAYPELGIANGNLALYSRPAQS